MVHMHNYVSLMVYICQLTPPIIIMKHLHTAIIIYTFHRTQTEEQSLVELDSKNSSLQENGRHNNNNYIY